MNVAGKLKGAFSTAATYLPDASNLAALAAYLPALGTAVLTQDWPSAFTTAVSMGQPAKAAATAMLNIMDRNRMLRLLVEEVNSAWYFIQRVKQWSASTDFCDKRQLDALTKEVEEFIKINFIQSAGFFEKAKAADTRVQQLLLTAKDDPRTFLENTKAFITDPLNDKWISGDPAYYRQELSFHMLRLIELVKESMMDVILSNRDKDTCSLKTKKIKVLPAAVPITAEFVRTLNTVISSPSAMAAGGRSSVKSSGGIKKVSQRGASKVSGPFLSFISAAVSTHKKTTTPAKVPRRSASGR